MKGGGFGLLGNITVGVIGAVVGGFDFGLLGISAGGLVGPIIARQSGGAAAVQTQPVGLGSPPYFVIGFIGPVIHILNIAFWSSPMYLENLRMGGTTACSS